MHKKFIRYAMQALLPLCFLSPTAFADNETVNFLAISDIHFDPFQYCGDTSPCKLIDTLSSVPASRWNEILAEDARVFCARARFQLSISGIRSGWDKKAC